MIKKISILSLALAAGMMTAIVAGRYATNQEPLQAMAQWKNVYKTPGGLVAGSDLIVVAEHFAAMPGRVVGEGEDATPFTDNVFSIKRVLRGEHNGDQLLVEQTGGIMANGRVFNINDGGPYTPGASYLLFLKSRGDGSYYVINHQARYEIKDDILEGVDPTDHVVSRLHGRTLDDGIDSVRRRARLVE